MTSEVYDYIVVGAGPAGCQMGFYLTRAERKYLILEVAEEAGHFFSYSPRHKTLISINKRFNGFPEAEYNMRHDWNSLLSDDPTMLFKYYDQELFPNPDNLVKYMKDYANKFNLNIKYKTKVTKIDRCPETQEFTIETNNGSFRAKSVLVATGCCSERPPRGLKGWELIESYDTHSLNQKDYENKRVCVIGRGNSAFEVANHLAGHACQLMIMTGAAMKHAWDSHFVGDLRAVNNTVIDMYQLKSLHIVRDCRPIEVKKSDKGTFVVTIEEDEVNWHNPGTLKQDIEFDKVIRCTGWKYVNEEMFSDSCRPMMDWKNKYPVLETDWSVKGVPGMYFLGTSMAANDVKAASGFIHGFRYNVRSLFHILENQYFGVPLRNKVFPMTNEEDMKNFCDFVLKRISIIDSLYQNNSFLCDIYKYCPESKTMTIKFEVPTIHVEEIMKDDDGYWTFTFQYGFHKYPEHVKSIDISRPPDFFNARCSANLHPVFKYWEGGKVVFEDNLFESPVLRWDGDYGNIEGHKHLAALQRIINEKTRVMKSVTTHEAYSIEEYKFERWSKEKADPILKIHQQQSSPCKFYKRLN